MMSDIKQEYEKATKEVIEYIKANGNKSKVSDWYFTYKRIRRLAKLSNLDNVDDLIRESGEGWLREVFSDQYFEEYYRLQRHAHRLEVLAKQ